MQAQLDSTEVSAGALGSGQAEVHSGTHAGCACTQNSRHPLCSSSRAQQHSPAQPSQSSSSTVQKAPEPLQEKLVAVQQALEAERRAHAPHPRLCGASSRRAAVSTAAAGQHQPCPGSQPAGAQQRPGPDEPPAPPAACSRQGRRQADSQRGRPAPAAAQQQRSPAAAAPGGSHRTQQAAASTFARREAGGAAASSRAQQQQHSLQQELEQARLERDQARGTIQDLTTQLQQANSARVAAERAGSRACAAQHVQHAGDSTGAAG